MISIHGTIIFIIIFILKPIPNHASTTEQIQHESDLISRNLELQCAPTNYTFLFDDDDGIMDAHGLDTYSQGEISRGLIDRLRGKDIPYYQRVLNNIIMTLCDDEDKERCVPSESSFAALDSNNTCLLAADTDCSIGYCERTSNCYWNPIIPNENRTTRFGEDLYENASNSLISIGKVSYARGVALISVIGIACAVLLFIIWMIFIIIRCCCHRSSYQSKEPKVATRKGHCGCLATTFILIASLAGILASGAIAYIGNEDIDIAITNSFVHMSGLFKDLRFLLTKTRLPLENIGNIVQYAADDAVAIFNDTGYINETAFDIMQKFEDFGSLHTDALALVNAQKGFDDAIDAFQEQVTPVVDNIQDMLDTLENDLYLKVDFIEASLESVTQQMESFDEQLETWDDQVQDYQKKEYDIRTVRKAIVLLVFLVSSTLALAGVIGVICRRRVSRPTAHLLDITTILSAIFASVILILASVSLVVAFVWHDICIISDLIVADFEPLVGEQVARGANAVFNNTNLAVAYNVTDKIDFQAKLDEGLSVIENTDIPAQFEMVLTPLEKVNDEIDQLTDIAFIAFSTASTLNFVTCPINDTYLEENMHRPWRQEHSTNTTSWIVNATGDVGNYTRQGMEGKKPYINRIYTPAGRCSSSTVEGSCCLQGNCTALVGGICNSGSTCDYSSCESVSTAITSTYDAYIEAYERERRIQADLGFECPEYEKKSEVTCPTSQFEALGHNETIVSLVNAYEANVSETSNDLINIASTSVGDTMEEVEDFLCHMNVSFIAERFYNAQEEVCENMLGGFTQVVIGLWICSVLLEFVAILSVIQCLKAQRVRDGSDFALSRPSVSSFEKV